MKLPLRLSFAKWCVFVLIAPLLLILTSACTLGTAQEARQLQMIETQTAAPEVSFATSAASDDAGNPALTPINATPGEIALTPLGSPAVVGGVCNQLRVDVGDDPGNTLRLRQQPTNTAEIILLIPNRSVVQRVAGSTETSSDGYTWVNIQYTDPNGVVATGWSAKNAMRDRTTLNPAC